MIQQKSKNNFLRKKSKVLLGLCLSLTPVMTSCSSSVSESQDYHAFRKLQKSHTVKDGHISYLDKGKGEAILLLHGVPSSGWLYRKMVDGLVEKGYRVIVPDMLGYGSSANPKGYEIYSPEQQAKRLVSLMDSLGIKKWNHVFHDVGGTWTWELLRDNQHRVNKLVMLNSIALADGFHPPVRMEEGVVAKTAMWGYRNGVTTDLLLDRLFEEGLKDPSKLTEADRAGYKIPLLEGKTKGMYYFFTQTCNNSPDYSDVIGKVRNPTAVIWGAHDTMLQWTPQSEAMLNKLSVSKSDVHIIDAKHFIQEEQPDLINNYIVQFLQN